MGTSVIVSTLKKNAPTHFQILPTASLPTENHCPSVYGDRVSIAVLQILQLASREPGKIPPLKIS